SSASKSTSPRSGPRKLPRTSMGMASTRKPSKSPPTSNATAATGVSSSPHMTGSSASLWLVSATSSGRSILSPRNRDNASAEQLSALSMTAVMPLEALFNSTHLLRKARHDEYEIYRTIPQDRGARHAGHVAA